MTELEKWANCHKEIIMIKEFLGFASYEENAELMRLEDSGEGFFSVYKPIAEDKLINAFFNIDGNKLEEERRAAYERHRAYQEKLNVYDKAEQKDS